MRRRQSQSGFAVRKRRRTNNRFAPARAGQVALRRRSNPRNAGFLGIEYKFLDSELTPTTLSTTTWGAHNPTAGGSVNTISCPAIGDTESSRDGKNYAITSVHVKGIFHFILSEAVANPIPEVQARVLIYWDKQTNATEATATDIMDGGGTNDVLAFRNLQQSTRFQVLFDKVITLRPHNLSEALNSFSTGLRRFPWTFNKRFKTPIRVNCVGTTANVSSVSDNNLGIIACADTANWVQIEYQARVRFVG